MVIVPAAPGPAPANDDVRAGNPYGIWIRRHWLHFDLIRGRRRINANDYFTRGWRRWGRRRGDNHFASRRRAVDIDGASGGGE
jgi:hypothetical protein